MNKLFLNLKTKIIHCLYKFSSIYKCSTFRSEERLINLVRGREWFVGLSTYILSLWCEGYIVYCTCVFYKEKMFISLHN